MNNISTVSFGSAEIADTKNTEERQIQIPDFMYSEPKQHKHLEYSPECDLYTTTTEEVEPKKKKGFAKAAIGFLTGVLAASGVYAGAAQLSQKNESVTIPYNYESESLTDISEIYGSDEDIICLCNGISEDSNLADYTELVIPSSFDYIQDEIDSKYNLLYSDRCSDAKRDSLEAEIEALQKKQELQNEVATVYTDGQFVYFSINDLQSNENLTQYESGINVEEFKKLFDISDGAVQKYNSLENCDWIVDSKGNGIIDYTDSYINSGDIIKVKAGAIAKNIDLSDYVEE